MTVIFRALGGSVELARNRIEPVFYFQTAEFINLETDLFLALIHLHEEYDDTISVIARR